MAGFYMLAGTMMSDLDFAQLQALLLQAGICSAHEADEDELALDMPAPVSITLRGGFAHEYIVVGDALEEQPLLEAVQRLSQVLDVQGISHEFEMYDPQNRMICEIGQEPVGFDAV